jgi:hypothetical protein
MPVPGATLRSIEHVFDRDALVVGRGKRPTTRSRRLPAVVVEFTDAARRPPMSASIDFPKPSRTRTTIPVPLPLPPTAAVELLAHAREGLSEAEHATDPADRFAVAYLAALRAAAAVLALRGRPHRGHAKPTSVWVLLAGIAPELTEWAAFFASGSATRAAVQAGITRVVTTRSADDLVRQAAQFVALVDRIMHEART